MNQGHISVHLLQTSLMHIKSSSRCILSLTSHRIPATLANTKPRITHILSVTKLKMKSALAIIMSLAFASVFAAAVPIDSGTQ